jgi:hypothetical protein
MRTSPSCSKYGDVVPWRLALVTLMQFAEGLSGRQAAEAVRGRIDWKCALDLELTDLGSTEPGGKRRATAFRRVGHRMVCHRFDKPFRKRDGERLTWVHIPVFLLASKTIITFCKVVVRAAAHATPTDP